MLHRARRGGIGSQENMHDRRARRIALQMQAQQLQKHFGIAHGHGQGKELFVTFISARALMRNFIRSRRYARFLMTLLQAASSSNRSRMAQALSERAASRAHA